MEAGRYEPERGLERKGLVPDSNQTAPRRGISEEKRRRNPQIHYKTDLKASAVPTQCVIPTLMKYPQSKTGTKFVIICLGFL